MASRMTEPRRLPTWIVPEGVFESLTTCGSSPRTRCASSSAQSTALAVSSADADDLVGEVAGRDLDDDLLPLLVAEQRAADRTLVRDAALRGLRLRRSDDRERLLAGF